MLPALRDRRSSFMTARHKWYSGPQDCIARPGCLESFNAIPKERAMNRDLFKVLGTCVVSLVAATTFAAGNEFPVKPVRIIVPNPPGGTVELVARSVGNVITPA